MSVGLGNDFNSKNKGMLTREATGHAQFPITDSYGAGVLHQTVSWSRNRVPELP